MEPGKARLHRTVGGRAGLTGLGPLHRPAWGRTEMWPRVTLLPRGFGALRGNLSPHLVTDLSHVFF